MARERECDNIWYVPPESIRMFTFRVATAANEVAPACIDLAYYTLDSRKNFFYCDLSAF